MSKGSIIGTCAVCHLGVRYVDDYIKMEDYIKGQLRTTAYFHRQCFKDKLNPYKDIEVLKNTIQNLALKTSDLLNGVNA